MPPGVSLLHTALQWVLRHRCVSTVLIGARSEAYVHSAMEVGACCMCIMSTARWRWMHAACVLCPQRDGGGCMLHVYYVHSAMEVGACCMCIMMCTMRH